MEIKANELRIGNYITMPFLGIDAIQVIGIAVKENFELFIQSKLNNNTFFEKPEKYKPIPLTEEWILRFGFELFQDKWEVKRYKLNDFTYTIPQYLNDIPKGLFYKGINFKNIEFIHQLQNIFFALTGEELTIKN